MESLPNDASAINVLRIRNYEFVFIERRFKLLINKYNVLFREILTKKNEDFFVTDATTWIKPSINDGIKS